MRTDAVRERDARQEEIDDRLLRWMASECVADSEVFWDLRKINGADTSDAFTPFWDEMASYLELEVGAGAEERRTAGSMDVTHAAKVISVPSLIREVATLLYAKEGFADAPVPCESTVRLQFMPSAPTKLASARFTARFRMVRKVQTRCIRKEYQMLTTALPWHATANLPLSRRINSQTRLASHMPSRWHMAMTSAKSRSGLLVTSLAPTLVDTQGVAHMAP